MSERSRRQRLIADYLTRPGPGGAPGVQNQEQLRDLLAKGGVDVTQGTLSRDLRALGVVKGPSGYILPGAGAGAGGVMGAGPAGGSNGTPRLKLTREVESSLRQHLALVGVAGNFVVLKTNAGHASVIAVALDRFPPRGVVGTVAGDDTVFVAIKSTTEAHRLAKFFRVIGGLA